MTWPQSLQDSVGLTENLEHEVAQQSHHRKDERPLVVIMELTRH
jgi:hypothetical protein